MSLRIRRITLDNFRKFRSPVSLDGLADGLNIIIEDNETGKSTLLEALRAAFFVKYSAKNQLTRSFAPHGEAVSPSVQVDFDVDGANWSISKSFLRQDNLEVSGPLGRARGQEAEAQLCTLLGSVPDNSRTVDVANYGALGLLWIAQTEALSVAAPGQIVRDQIASILENEVGSIMGGPAYAKVRERVDTQFNTYWSASGRDAKGPLKEAANRLAAAQSHFNEAQARLDSLEATFARLENTRVKLKGVERDLADPTDADRRVALEASLKTAQAAAQILETRKAAYEAASAKSRRLRDLQDRHRTASQNLQKAHTALLSAQAERAQIAAQLETARSRAREARESLEACRQSRQMALKALESGEQQQKLQEQAQATAAARIRHSRLLSLEAERETKRQQAALEIPAKVVTRLEELDRDLTRAQVRRSAGATKITYGGPVGNDAPLLLDGQPLAAGDHILSGAVTLRFGQSELRLTPPASAEQAEADYQAAHALFTQALAETGLPDLASVRARNLLAHEAETDVRRLEIEIQAVTPADPLIDLAAGPEALKLYIASLGADVPAPPQAAVDLGALKAAVTHAETELAKAEGVQQSTQDALRTIEASETPRAMAEASADSEVKNARNQMDAIEALPEFADLDSLVAKADQEAAEAAVRLSEAERDALAHDAAAIGRQIKTLDERQKATQAERNQLLMEVARLEKTVEIEGGEGLADRHAAAREEVEAAEAALARASLEGETLKLLRDTLETARRETSARFVGPVATRAKRHIERLLPGSELHFTEDLALASVSRGKQAEECGQLSRGTQEQLALLTRIAFADMLLELGHPVSLILDDPLVYSDDARLDVMIDILREVSQRMQVILLTCRHRAFRHVEGNRLSLSSL